MIAFLWTVGVLHLLLGIGAYQLWRGDRRWLRAATTIVDFGVAIWAFYLLYAR